MSNENDQITLHFKKREMRCKCGKCEDLPMDSYFMNQLEIFRVRDIKKPIYVISGHRCREYNDKLREEYKRSKGKSGANTAVNSQHINLKAADIYVKGMTASELLRKAKESKLFDYMYAMNTSIHVDTRYHSGEEKTYTVKKGDTLFGIAKKYNLTKEEIIKRNPQLGNINLIFLNQKINL